MRRLDAPEVGFPHSEGCSYVKESERVAELYLTPCDPMDCSPPGSSVHGILQARILEWVAIPFSRGSSHPGIKFTSPALQTDSLPSEPIGKPTLEEVEHEYWQEN